GKPSYYRAGAGRLRAQENQEDTPMTISASTDQPPYNISRSLTLNACFIIGTVAFAVAVFAAECAFSSFQLKYLQSPPPAFNWATVYNYNRLFNLSWLLIALMLIGIVVSIATFISIVKQRRRDSAVPVRVNRLGTALMVVSFFLGVLSLLFLALIMPQFYELCRTFELAAPDITRLYLSFSDIITNPIGIAFSSFVLAPLAIFFVAKEFRLKDIVTVYLLNSFVAICILLWLVFAYMAALLPFIVIVDDVLPM
ncbi:MAG: hypothetical protein ACYDCO_28285, partial [Armatimonadota bacterium]